jgi:hypothetical protein
MNLTANYPDWSWLQIKWTLNLSEFGFGFPSTNLLLDFISGPTLWTSSNFGISLEWYFSSYGMLVGMEFPLLVVSLKWCTLVRIMWLK